MTKVLRIVWVIIVASIMAAPLTEARSGCCSHHGGVCGCGCCDGSDLSATCAPYYPECSGGGDYNESAKPRCPAHSTSDGYSCTCDYGYAPFGQSCVKVPANAHAVSNGADAWECDSGYREAGSTCVQETPTPPIATPTAAPAPVPVAQEASSQTPISSSPLSPKQEDSPASGVLGAAVIGGGGYWYLKRRQKKALAKK